MQLISAFIYVPEPGHEGSDFPPPLLYALWQMPANVSHLTVFQIRYNFLRNKQYPGLFHSNPGNVRNNLQN